MSRYCKAYRLEDLRKFSGWSEMVRDNEKELNNDSIVYIQENTSVTTNPLDLDSQEDYIFDKTTPEWETFCKDELNFEVPVWEEVGAVAPQEGTD